VKIRQQIAAILVAGHLPQIQLLAEKAVCQCKRLARPPTTAQSNGLGSNTSISASRKFDRQGPWKAPLRNNGTSQKCRTVRHKQRFGHGSIKPKNRWRDQGM
jgi:hypothetical protein